MISKIINAFMIMICDYDDLVKLTKEKYDLVIEILLVCIHDDILLCKNLIKLKLCYFVINYDQVKKLHENNIVNNILNIFVINNQRNIYIRIDKNVFSIIDYDNVIFNNLPNNIDILEILSTKPHEEIILSNIPPSITNIYIRNYISTYNSIKKPWGCKIYNINNVYDPLTRLIDIPVKYIKEILI